ncbi:MAG: iron-containing alcohol dehydrogenase [Planctomycetaceae bacterium]|nr:iron-containing alcohol dehydrogenase [Planctomycetaceae bacterium]
MPSDPLPSDQLVGFDFSPRTRVVFGPGVVDRLGTLAAGLGGQRILLVTDKGLAEAGHEQHGLEALRSAGLEVTVFDDVHSNPTTDDVDRCVAVAREANVNLIVGLGGGSSMDCAKGCNFLVSCGGRMEDYWGIGKATGPMLPMIAVPTTAGTGSEAQSFALIADSKTHMKMACGDRRAAFSVALLDPVLTLTQPKFVTAVTGIDAVSHAVETYVTRKRNPVSQVFSRAAWQAIGPSFPTVCREPSDPAAPTSQGADIEARAAMQLGAHWAGAAIENSMLGATHSMANPLSAHFHLTHGVAIGVMLPHVIRYNAPAVGPLYGELAADVGLCAADDPQAAGHLAGFVRELTDTAQLPATLAECDIDPALIPTLAIEAAKQWTAQFNPRPVAAADFEEMYRCAWNER